MTNEKFLDDIPDLQYPAGLVIYKGQGDQDGSRARRWSLVLAYDDPAGEAYLAATGAMDAIVAALGGASLDGLAAYIPPTLQVAAVESGPGKCVYEVAFETHAEMDAG